MAYLKEIVDTKKSVRFVNNITLDYFFEQPRTNTELISYLDFAYSKDYIDYLKNSNFKYEQKRLITLNKIYSFLLSLPKNTNIIFIE